MQEGVTPGGEHEPETGFTIIALKSRDLPGVHAQPACRKCSCEDGYLARYIKSNGQTGVRWVCDWCEDYGTAGDLPRALLGDVHLGQIPLRVDRSVDPSEWPECVVCGNPADEFHHWAPVSVFPDWPYWIGAYLCTPHHREWHRVMREHGLRWPHEIAA